MEDGQTWSRAVPGQSRPHPDTRDGRKTQGPAPRLSEVNLFTLLSLWMELFPRDQPEEDDNHQIRGVGLVVARDGTVVGLHCSGADLHAGQAAIIQHGARLADCQLYFSRRPCATCLKMLVNAGVSQISFWPGDPEVSMASFSEEAALDAAAAEKIKSNSRPQVVVVLQPLAPGLLRFVLQSFRDCDFIEKMTGDDGAQAEDVFNRERARHMEAFSKQFLVATDQQHRDILTRMGLVNFCMEPYFTSLRHDMRELVEVLAAVAARLPHGDCGFHREQLSAPPPSRQEDISQEVARHCIVQALLLSYRTEDAKVGVGAVIWAKGESAGCSGTGRLCLIGCGYNAYPTGSQYAEYPQMDYKQEDRRKRKYRFIVHAEQNALTFRTRDIRPGEPTLLFVTKCPCDECIPLIRGAGITHVYTSDHDMDKDKEDISYLRFSRLTNISKFTWQRSPPSHLTNGSVGKHGRQPEQESHSNKKRCTGRSTVS